MSLTRTERGDLRLLRIYALTIPTVMRYRRDPEWAKLTPEPAPLLTRFDAELAGESFRYRVLFAAMLAVLLMPGLLALFLWSGLYWLPVRIVWTPFYRGEYGLPWFSLFEWLAYAFLGLFLAVGWALLRTSRARTRCMAADLTVLASATPEEREAFAREALAGHYPRAELILRTAAPFAPYRALLGEERGR